MRDIRCNKKRLEIIIRNHPINIEDEKNEISILSKDELEGVQRYPRENKDIIYDTKVMIIKYIRELMHSQYSYGMDMDEFDGLFDEMIQYLCEIRIKDIGYINLLHLISYGILLQKTPNIFDEIVRKMDEEEINDLLIDALLQAYGIERNYHSDEFFKENPYKYLLDIICSSYSGQENVSDLLKNYVSSKWLKGHSDYGWVKSVKSKDFRGLWSYEAAAVAKLFDIDDSSLKDAEFYPYDFAHYKPTTIKAAERKGAIADQKEMSYEAEEDLIIDAKAIIPPCFYKHVNDFVGDYRKLSDEAFLEKYELDQIWSELDEYAKEKNSGEMLGKLLVFELTEKGYILQLDWKEDFEDFRDHMKNYWSKDGETKVITFELDNDQQYFARIPVDNNIQNLFEIPVKVHE
ncbi:PoNe immunity protein domain-containing protein [Butyrivibrio proteoclasticus]|uniref:PoNe immunity protein domain-containing protein n=1 Tax=Butyrivibrio proteoclasticus TaxID=43305 RepID=UPI00047B3B64|nr:PoNe immunity protein domain-containing protein [Butyrivibrio proteoclasticus]